MRAESRRCGQAVLAAILVLAFPRPARPADPNLSFKFAQFSEGWRVASGGAAIGNAYLDYQRAEFEISDTHLLDSQPLIAHIEAAGGNGHSVSALSGDAQGISNIEGIGSWRMYQVWIDWLPAGNYSLRAGLYDLNSEFDSVDTAALFINSSHGIGPSLGLSGLNGPSIFPITSLALRLQSSHTGRWWQIAILDAVPGSARNPYHPCLRVSGHEGALIVAEAGRGDATRGKLGIGLWQYTARFDPIAGTSTGVRPARRSAAAAGTPIPAVESNFELSWRTTPRAWLALQSTAQYILRPGRSDGYGNALALGLRAELSTSWER